MKVVSKEKVASATAGPTLHTLDDLATELGPPSPEVVAELFEDVTPAVLLAFGRRADSAVLYGGIPTFVSSVRDIWGGLSNAKRDAVIGYAEEFLPVLVRDGVSLRELHGRFSKQGPKVAIEVARRKESARLAFTLGRGLRDQGARMLRRVTRGKAEDSSSLETSIGTATDATQLAAGLTFVADEIERHLQSGSAVRRSLMARIKMTAAYVQQLRKAAASVVTTDSAASAASREGVSQEDLDQADGRVMHVVDWVYRAFKEANELDESIRVPDLGTLAPYFTKRRTSGTDDGTDDTDGTAKPVKDGEKPA